MIHIEAMLDVEREAGADLKSLRNLDGQFLMGYSSQMVQK